MQTPFFNKRNIRNKTSETQIKLRDFTSNPALHNHNSQPRIVLAKGLSNKSPNTCRTDANRILFHFHFKRVLTHAWNINRLQPFHRLPPALHSPSMIYISYSDEIAMEIRIRYSHSKVLCWQQVLNRLTNLRFWTYSVWKLNS